MQKKGCQQKQIERKIMGGREGSSLAIERTKRRKTVSDGTRK